MQSSTDINIRRVLVGHRAAVNVVDFDQKYIVSASGDRTIKVRISDAVIVGENVELFIFLLNAETFDFLFRFGTLLPVNLYAH